MYDIVSHDKINKILSEKRSVITLMKSISQLMNILNNIEIYIYDLHNRENSAIIIVKPQKIKIEIRKQENNYGVSSDILYYEC